MPKWYEDSENQQEVFLASRIRLSRNVKGHPFPASMPVSDAAQLVNELRAGLNDANLNYYELWKLPPEEREALKERRVFNSTLAANTSPMGLFLSEDESDSILLGGDDHVRLQVIISGMALRRAWETIDKLDDYVNQKFEYAFDNRYGYLTAFPTNVGTGLRASVILHLPVISTSKSFRKLTEEVNRVGLTIKGIFGEPSENYGALYQVANQKTLGLSEDDIIASVHRLAGQLAAQERRARADLLKNNRNTREDEVYKSYGVLKYARKLTLRDGLIYLSQLRSGLTDGLIGLKNPINVYGMMLKIQPGNLQQQAGKALEQEEIEYRRAEYIRNQLPELS